MALFIASMMDRVCKTNAKRYLNSECGTRSAERKMMSAEQIHLRAGSYRLALCITPLERGRISELGTRNSECGTEGRNTKEAEAGKQKALCWIIFSPLRSLLKLQPWRGSRQLLDTGPGYDHLSLAQPPQLAPSSTSIRLFLPQLYPSC